MQSADESDLKNALTSRKIKDELCGLFCFKYSEEFELNLDYYNRMIEIEKLLVGRMDTFGGFLGRPPADARFESSGKCFAQKFKNKKVNKQLTN